VSTHGYITPVMLIDESGCMPDWLKKLGIVAIVAVIVVVTVALTVSTAGLGTVLMAGAVYGVASGGAQMISNYKHGEEDIMKNVAGAIVGGFISGATLGSPVGQITAGYVNAVVNEVENEWLYDKDPEVFNIEDVIYEGTIYAAANLVTSWIPNAKLQQDLAVFIDFLAFDFSDTNKDAVTQKLRDYFD